jgi:hypothetical protein
MSTVESAAHLFGDEHVRSYLETDGKIGYRWKEGSPIAILFTTARTSGEQRANPLIFGRDGDNVVLVASKAVRRSIPAGTGTFASTQMPRSRSWATAGESAPATRRAWSASGSGS